MDLVREKVRADLRARLVARGAADDFGEARVFDEVDALFRRAIAQDDPQALLMPELLAERWRPELSLRLATHRGGLAASIVLFAKQRVLLPLTRWLFEYALENFRRQDRLNLALMSVLQSMAADQARLQRRLAVLEANAGRGGTAAETHPSSR